MEIKIGIQQVTRELVLETETLPEDLQAAFTRAAAENTPFVVETSTGGTVTVRGDALAYLETGRSTPRTVGFGAI